MIRSYGRPVLVAGLAILAPSVARADDPTVTAVSATLGGPTTFLVAVKGAAARQQVVSSSLLIQNVLLPALLSGATEVGLELVPGSNVIRRVDPFAPGAGAKADQFEGGFVVSRIATQRKTDGTGEHLEVFVKKDGSDDEKAYNVFDPSLQQVLLAAFRGYGKKALRVDLKFDGDDIVTVTLGAKLRPAPK
jgi:hypothetical protein